MVKIFYENILLIFYIFSWVAYEMVLLWLPMRSGYQQTHQRGVLLLFLYVIISVVSAILVRCFISCPSLQSNWKLSEESVKKVRIFLWTLTGLMMIGLCLHLYDKIIIRNIDYSQGLAYARHAWIASSTAYCGDVSSWQSALGHLLSNLFFAVVVLVILFRNDLKVLDRRIIYCLSVFALLVYSGSMGSRTVPYLWIACLFSSCFLYIRLNWPRCDVKRLSALVLVTLIVICAYSFSIFKQRSEAYGEGDSKKYAASFAEQLHGEITDVFDFGWFGASALNNDSTLMLTPQQIANNVVGRRGESAADVIGGNKFFLNFTKDVYYLTVLTAVYVVHNQWTLDYVLTLDSRTGSAIFTPLMGVFSKLKIISAADIEPRSYKGVFLSLPGCVWYDFGTIGLILIAFFHGVCITAASCFFGTRPRVRHLFFFMLVSVFSLISTFTAATNMMSFPFLLLSFFVVFAGLAAILPMQD